MISPRSGPVGRAREGWTLAFTMAASVGSATAADLQVLHSFSGGADGDTPHSTLAIDALGNLYGTSYTHGEKGGGAVYRMGAEGFTILHAFDVADGALPRGALLLDPDGSLWGTTSVGGESGGGTAFRVDPAGRFQHVSMRGGRGPEAGLTRGPDGGLYGVTRTGCDALEGTVFRLDPATLALTTIHSFDGHDGSCPMGALLSADGRLHGTTFAGGQGDRGTVFALDPDGGGFGTQRARAGGWIQCGLTLDAQGRAWGIASVDKPVTPSHGKGAGGIFTLQADGQISLVHRFDAQAEGHESAGELLLGRDGWLYGMTTFGGRFDQGTLFRFDPASAAFEVLHHFTGGKDDGGQPYSTLSQDASGALYGTATQGGAYGLGVVFRFVP